MQDTLQNTQRFQIQDCGIDGMVLHGDQLLAVQSSIGQPRIIAISIDGDRATGLTVGPGVYASTIVSRQLSHERWYEIWPNPHTSTRSALASPQRPQVVLKGSSKRKSAAEPTSRQSTTVSAVSAIAIDQFGGRDTLVSVIASSEMSHFAYDVFVIHADAAADEAFVNGYLLARLGLPPERVLRLQTLELGQLIAEEIERGVRSSRVTVVVLSAAYMDDPWAGFGEQLAAHARTARLIQGVLLPLLLEDCKLTMHAQSLVKLDFRASSRASWEAEIKRLQAYLDQPEVKPSILDCPYPGMRPFTENDAARFFGREVELETILYRLRHGEREIYVIGASGSGKSSLIRAGLIPRLMRGVEGLPRFHIQTIRPGERRLEQLTAVRDGDATTPVAAVGNLLMQHAPETVLLLVIDQLEELFATAGDAQRRDFLAAVRALRADTRCVLLFNLRADFYGAFLTSSLWTDNEGRISRIDLGPLGGDNLRVAIERPARDVGVYVEPQLVSRLLDDAAGEPGALPLLQETLLQLWSNRRERLLTIADYRGLSNDARSGLAAAVEKHADFVLGRLTSAERRIAYRILLRLVNFGEGRADTRRQQRRDVLRSAGELRTEFDGVFQRLVEHRLVTVTAETQCDDVRVDLAHEILIDAWATFAEHIKAWRAQEQRRREFESWASAWYANGCSNDGLLGAARLAAAVSWREQAALNLGHTAELARFMEASELAQTEALLQEAEQRQERSRLLAESAQIYQEIGRQQLEAENPLEALPYFVAARQAMEASGRSTTESLRMLFARAMRNMPVSPPLQHCDNVVSAAFSPDGTRVVTASWDKTARVWDAATGIPLSPPLQHQASVGRAAFSPDGTRVVTASSDNTARVWDAATGTPLSPPLQHQGIVRTAAFSPNSTRIVTASSDGTARVWNAATGTPLSPPLQHKDAVWSAAFDGDGARVVTASADRTGRVWDAVTGTPLSPPLSHQSYVESAVFASNGTCVITAGGDRTARIWDAATGEPLGPPLQHQDDVVSAVFSPDGTRIVTASFDKTAQVWNAVTGMPVVPALQHERRVESATFSPDGACIVTAGDGAGRIWDAATGSLLPPMLPHQHLVRTAVFSRDGTRVVTGSSDGTARVWHATSRPQSPPLRHQHIVWTAVFSPDGTRVVTASADHTARIWDAATSKPLSSPMQHQSDVWCAAFSRDGGRVATASSDGTARVWDAATGKLLFSSLQHQSSVGCAAFSIDGTRIVTASADHTARVWDAATGNPLSPPLQHRGPVIDATFCPDGTRVLTASSDHTARVWDAVTGTPLSALLLHQGRLVSAAFSPDGSRIVTASWGSTARVWDAATGKPVSRPLHHQGRMRSEFGSDCSRVFASFSPDSSRVVTASLDKTARMWDAATGAPLFPPLQHQDGVRSALFSPDGTRVVTTCWDQTARVWNAITGLPLSPPLQHEGRMVNAAFSPDGTRVVTASSDKTARVWDAATGKPLSAPLQHQGYVLRAAFSADGNRVITASVDHTARVWELPLAAGALADWRASTDIASPYILSNGVLLPKIR